MFDIELQYTERFTDAEQIPGRVGDYIGSGKGTVDGPTLRGKIPRWDLYEDVLETVCRSNLSGTIETDDGAQIAFDSMGLLMVPDKSQPHRWITSAAVMFETEDERYAWLNYTLGIWEGTFDMESYRHHYRVYTQSGSKNNGMGNSAA
jgi:hypothetical protein